MKILTEQGFKKFDGFHRMGEKETFSLQCADGIEIRCTVDHEFLTDEGLWKRADCLEPCDILNGAKFISLIPTNQKEVVYDAINVEDTSSFYAEGVIAHNCSFLYIDETAFVENWDTFFASVFPTISSGNTTKILLTSTPNGLNHFYKTFTGAKEERNGYAWVEVPWQRVPKRDDNWKQGTLAAMDFDTQKFAQEFECVTGDTIVTVRDKETLEIKEMRIDQLYKELNT